MFGSELTETNNEPTFRVFNIQNLTPKKFLIFAGLSLFQGGGRTFPRSPWLHHYVFWAHILSV